MSGSPLSHDWSVVIGGHLFGLVGDTTVSGSFTILHYGSGFVQIPMHIYGVASIGVLVPIILLVIVYAIISRYKKHSA
jgi:hypothetical protein